MGGFNFVADADETSGESSRVLLHAVIPATRKVSHFKQPLKLEGIGQMTVPVRPHRCCSATRITPDLLSNIDADRTYREEMTALHEMR